MQITVVSIAVFVPFVAFVSGIERRQTPLETAVVRECFDIVYRYSCESSYARDGANIGLGCGPDYYPAAESYASQCTRASNGEYCFHLFTDTDEYSAAGLGQATTCAPVVNSTSPCPTECRNYLQAAVDAGGCCFQTIFNERLSQILLRHDVDVSLVACNVSAPPQCEVPVDLTPPDNPDSCTPSQFWARSATLLCGESGQGLVDALLENPVCLPLARHQVNACGRSRDHNNRYCLDLFETSINPVNPMRTIFLHTELSEAVTSCSNFSTFQSEGCPSHCQNALEVALGEVGCCINIFNDTVNEILQPHFSGEVLAACLIDSPGKCESDLVIGDGSITVKAITTWVYVCLVLWYGLN